MIPTHYSVLFALGFNFKFKMFINRINTLKNVNRPLGRCFSSWENFSPAKLAYTAYEDLANSQKGIPFLIMHGLLGSKQNWTSLCKVYSQNVNPARKIIALDLRNHGDSEHSQHHSYSLLVEDVRHFLLDLNIKKISLMGHSMGGRCAMLFALRYPELLEKLIVVDISPISGPQINEMPVILGVMKSIQMPKNVPLSVARTIVDNHLAEVISKKDVRAFILTNLVATEDQSYKWRVNVTALSEGFHEMFNFPALDNAQYKGETLFIGGARSNYLPYHDGSRPKRLVYAVDLRNHGDSAHTKDNTYDDLVMDVLKFLKSMNLKKIFLLGHEVGGRVGMLLSLKYPELVEKLIVADMSPITTSHSFKVFSEVLRTLNDVHFPPNLQLQQAKAHVVNCLSRIVKNKGLMSLVLTNLVQKSDGSYTWRFNNRTLLEHFQELSAFPDIYNVSFHGPVLFVGGAKSDYIQKSDYTKILKFFPKAELKYIEGAGHWVHAEKPNEFLKLTMDFLNKTSSSIS